jgi:hypothetical protein
MRDVIMTARRGGLIGLVSGLLAGPIMFLWLAIYMLVVTDDLGSTAVLGPFSGGIQSTILGCILGPIAAAFVGLTGRQLTGTRRCLLFGVLLMGAAGGLEALSDYVGSPDRFVTRLTLIIGLDIVSPVMAGLAGGALVGRLSKRSPS